MNTFTIAGNLGRDARLNSIDSKNGPVSVANFTVAVQKRKDDPTLWVDCALWGKRADALAPYLTKGSKVTVSGEAGIDSFEGKDGTVPKLTLRVAELTLQGGGQKAESAAPTAQQAPADVPDDDDIPF